jgi:DNA-binding beta-propeller fold protein YncE
MKKILFSMFSLVIILQMIGCSKQNSSTTPSAISTPNATATMTAMFVTAWGNTGTGNGQFGAQSPYVAPLGMALDNSGNVYVTDTRNERIEEFTSAGVYITQWGSGGSGNGQLGEPTGIAINRSNGNVYVDDPDNYRIEEFTSAGVYITQWGSQGSLNGLFSGFSYGIAVDSVQSQRGLEFRQVL